MLNGDGIEQCSRIGFGTIHVTEQRGFGPTRQNAVELLRRAFDLGVRIFDTADSYGPCSAEEVVREALHPYHSIIIATKGGFHHDTPNDWIPDGRPEHLRQAVEGSLRRLQCEVIDLYQLHCPDPQVPYEESIGTLRELQSEGKIRFIGVSNVDLLLLQRAESEAKIVSVQNPYNIWYTENTEVLDHCEEQEIIFFPWMPLGDRQIPWDDAVLLNIAKQYNATPVQIALAALLHRSRVIVPIPGTSSLKHLEENVSATKLVLKDETITELWPDWRDS